MIKPVQSLSALLIVSFLVAAVLPSLAEVPRKKPLTRYTQLWTKSAFTVPPDPPEVEVEEDNPLEEYTLAGAGKLKGGWFVVLMHKKDRERVRLSLLGLLSSGMGTQSGTLHHPSLQETVRGPPWWCVLAS